VATLPGEGDYTFTVTITDSSGLTTTSTVSLSAGVAPFVSDVAFDFRSKVVVTFSKDVSSSLQPTDLSVLPSGAAEAIHPDTVVWDADARTATFGFAANLPDGDYRATLASGDVTDVPGRPLAADRTYDFFAFAGDATRDRTVDFNDLVALAQNYNADGPKTYADGDFSGDGVVDFNDLVLLAQRYNTTLPTTPAAAPVAIAGAAPMPSLADALAAAAARPKVTPDKKKPAKASVFSVTPVAKPKATAKAVKARR
jgi:hypothetical protein